MTMDAYREMARDAARATRQRGDAAMARYFGARYFDNAALALAGRIRRLQQMAALQVSSLYKSPLPRANFIDPTMAVPLGLARPGGGAPQPIAEAGLRSAMAASAGALGQLIRHTAILGKTPVSPALLRQHWRVAAALPARGIWAAISYAASRGIQQTTGNAAAGEPANVFRGLTINSDLCATANNKPAMGSSYQGSRLIVRRLIPAIRAMSAVTGHAGIDAVQTPGFGKTVRPPAAGQTAGDVFLDKQLVGYHLAAAITAEQTRAAARPNISGSAFNSSMAALRPSGAGL